MAFAQLLDQRRHLFGAAGRHRDHLRLVVGVGNPDPAGRRLQIAVEIVDRENPHIDRRVVLGEGLLSQGWRKRQQRDRERRSRQDMQVRMSHGPTIDNQCNNFTKISSSHPPVSPRLACARAMVYIISRSSLGRSPGGQRSSTATEWRKGQPMQLNGIHHLTAISAKPRENLSFYTGLLGMRLVKKTVNQDDVSAYHLFYADGKANPGTDLTFFDFPAAPERRGTNSISRTVRRVAGEKVLGFRRHRRKRAGGHTGEVIEVDGGLTLPFEDGQGQRLVRVDAGGAGSVSAWEKSPVPPEHQIRGLGPIVLTVHDLARTEQVLTGVMNMGRVRAYAAPGARIHVFAMGEGGPAAELHVIESPDLQIARQGAGGVHHVAFRTPDEAQYHAWTERLNELGIRNSGEIDRFYSRSLYFREPNGILFEIAPDGPGFATDEPMETLGEKLALPPFLEPRRAEIEAGLKPIG